MKFKDVNIGDFVYVNDWSYVATPEGNNYCCEYMNLFNQWEIVTKKKQLPGGNVAVNCFKKKGERKKHTFNNLHIKHIDGKEYFIKARFVSKINNN